MTAMNLKLITVLSVSHLLIDLTGGALPVIMPFLKEGLTLSYAQVGAVIMLSNVTASFIQPLFGHLSDRRHIRWLLPASVALTYGGFCLIGFSPTYTALLVWVVLSGLGVASYHPESFKQMHSFTGSRAATGMSFFQLGGNLGLALGPLFASFSMQAAGLSGTLLFAIPGVPILLLLLAFRREWTPVEGSSKAAARSSAPSTPEMIRPWTSMGLLVLSVTMRSWAHVGLFTFLPFHYIHVLNGDPHSAGRLVFVFLIGGAAGTLMGGVVADRIGYKRYFLLTMILSTPLLFLLPQAKGIGFAVILFVAGVVLVSSFSVTIVMGQQILHNHLGMASGLMMGFVIGMGGVGAGLLGVVADTWGVTMVLKLIAFMPLAGVIPLWLMPDPARKPAGARGA